MKDASPGETVPKRVPTAAPRQELDTSDSVNLRASLSGNLDLVPVGVDQTLWFSFVPNGANGTERASVEADYVEARIRYQR